MAEVRPCDIASLCFDARGQKFMVVVGSQISKLATGRKAASFFELLELGVKRAVDLKFKANANPEERRKYKEGLVALIPTNPLHVADEIHSQLREVCFYQWLRQEFRQFKIRNQQPTSVLKCLQKVGGRLLTTNYDLILEKSKLPPNCKFGGEVPESDRPLNVLAEGDYENIAEVIAGPKQAIVHLFGTYESDIVFTTSDHKSYTSNADAMAHLQSIFYHSHVLFVGFEKDDPFLNTLYKVMRDELRMEKRLGSTRNRHYILVPNSELRTFSNHFKGVLPVPYGSSLDELVNFLKTTLEAIDSHQRGQKRRKDDDEENGDLPPGIKRAHLISEDRSAIRQTASVVPEYFNIPKDKILFGADTGPFASIHFSIDMPEEYIPTIWDEAVRSNNVFVKCGCMAIQIGTGPMLWMREHHGPEHPLPGQQLDANQGDGQGVWTKIKPRRRAWHHLPDLKPFEIRQQVKISARDQGDQAKTRFGDLKRDLKERYGCSSVYRWSKNFVTFVCQGSEESVKIAVKFLQRQSQEHFSKQYSKVKSDRQFACEDCDVVWWAYVPKGYPVTLCPKCHTCYKALNRWDQYGYADFECSCGLKFEGSDRFYKWSSIECPRCSELVRPYRIHRPHQKPLTVKRPSALTLSPFTAKGAVQKNVPPRQIPDKHLGNEPVGGTRKPQEQKQIPQSLTKDAQEILTRWPKSSRSAKVEDTAKTDDTSEASSVHPKPLHHPFILKHAGKPIASLFQDQVSDLKPELLRSQEEKSKPTQRNHPPISRSKYQMKKERELQRKSVSRKRKFSARMNSTSNFARKNSGTQPVVSEVGEQDKRYAPKIAKDEQLSDPSNQQLPAQYSKEFTAMQGGELPEVVQKLFQTLGEIPPSPSISGPSDTAATVNSGEVPRESSRIANSSASGFSPNVLKKLKLLEEPAEAGNLVPDAALNDRKGSMEASLTSRPLLRALISSSSTEETTVTKHSTADIRFMPTALSETHNFLTASETGTKLVFTSSAMRETGSKSTSQNSFQETVLEVDTQGGSSCTTPSVHTHTAQHPRESNVKGEWTDIECLPSESCAESKTSDVEFVPINEAQMVCSGIPLNSQNSSTEVTHRVEANRIVQTAINNALERVGDGQICSSRTQDLKSDAGISPEGLSVDDVRCASHKFIQQATCIYSDSNLEVANTNMSPESDLRVPLPSSGRQDTKESFLPRDETERPVVFHLSDQTDINQQRIHSEKQPEEETVRTEFMHEKLQSAVQSFSTEQLKERSESRTDSSQEVHSGAVSLDVRNFNTGATAVDGCPENEKSHSLDTKVSGEITIEEQAVELVPEIKHSSENKAAEECKLRVHKITMASAHGVDTTSVYSEQLEVKVEELQKREGSVISGAHGTLLLKLEEEKESSNPGNESSRIYIAASSDDVLGEEPLASLEAIENSDQSILPNALNSSCYNAHISSEKLECESKVVFGVSSDLVGKKEVVENYPHMVERVNPVAVMNSSETNVQEMLQPFSEVDDIGSQSSPLVHNMNVERDAELCKVHVPEISVACSNPIEDGGHSLGDGSSEDDQALNNTPTTATTGLSASTSTTASFEIGIPSDDNACSVQISLEQQSQISKLHASSQPDSTINTDTGPHPSYQGSSNTRTGKVAHDVNAEVVINRLEDATDTSTPVERTTDSTMTQPPYCNADIVSPEMRTKTTGEDDSDSEESHLQTYKEQLGHCLIANETSTVIQTLVGPRTSKHEGITQNGTVNPQEEGMPCMDNGLEPHRRSQDTECVVCKTELVLEILNDILEAAVQEGDCACTTHSICNPKEREPLDELAEFSSFSQQEEFGANLKEETKVKVNPSGSSHTGKVAHDKPEEVVTDRLKDSTDTSELVQETPDSSMAHPHSRADIASPDMRPETSETGTENVIDSEESHLQTRKEQVDPLEVCLIARPREETTLKQTLMRPSTSNPRGITLNGEVDPQKEDLQCSNIGPEPLSSLNSDQGRSQGIACEVCETDDILEAAVQEGDHACAPHSICNPKERELLVELAEFGSFSSVSQQGTNLEEKLKVKASPSGSPRTGKVALAEQAEVVIDRLEDSTDTSELVQGTPDSSMAQPHSRADIASPHLRPETSETGTENVSDTEESHLQARARKEQVDPLEICLIAREETTLKQTLVQPSTSNPEEITLNGEVDPQEEDVPCINNGLEPHSSLNSDQGRSQVITYEVCETEMVLDILDDILEAAVQGDHACAPHSISNPKEQEPLDELEEFGSFSSVSQQGTNVEEKSKVKASPSGSPRTCEVAHTEQVDLVIDRLEDSTDASELVQGTPDSSMAQPQSNADIASLESRLETSEHDRKDTNVSKKSHLQSSKGQLVTCTIKETPEEPRASKYEEIPPNVEANSQEESVPCNNDRPDSSNLSSDQGRLQDTECKTELDIVEASVQESDHACVPSSDWNQREQEQLAKSSSFSPAPQQDEKELKINLSSSPHTDKVICGELPEAEIGRPEDSTNGSPVCRSPESPTAQLPTGSTNNTTPEMRHTQASKSDGVDSKDPEEYHLQSSKDDDPSKCVVHNFHESVVQEGDCACTQHDTCHPDEQERLPDVGSYSPVTQQNQIRAGLERESKINPSSSLCTGEVAHAEKTEIVIPNDTLELFQEVPDSTMSQPLHSSAYTEHLKMLSAETDLEDIKEPEELHVQGSKEQIDPLEVCFVAKETLNTTSEEPKVPKSEDLPLNNDTDSQILKDVSGSYVNNGSGFLPAQKIDQSAAVGTTEYGTVHVIALDILNDIIYAVIQKCHEHIPLDDHEPELALPQSDNLTPCISTPEPDNFNREDHRVPKKAVTNGSCPTVDLVAAANSSVLVVASAAGTLDEHTVHRADFGHRESSPLASEEDKGVIETKGIEVVVGNGGEASTASARESKSSVMGMSPPYSETDSESESSGSDGYEQDASETEIEETISQTPQDVATIEVRYVLEESAPDQSLSEPDAVCKQDTLHPAKVKDTVQAHHRTTPSVFTEQELSHPSPSQVQTRTKKRPRYLSKFKDKDQKIRRNVYIPSERHNCTGDTDDETRSAGLQARPVVFEFKQEIFQRL